MKNEKKKNKGVIGKIVKIIFFIIAFFILLIAGIILYKANKYPDKVPDVLGIKPMIVLSGSMETDIHKGDLVFVKMTDPKKLKVNDVIAFRNEEDSVTTHRIIEIVMENGVRKFKTKGDANNSSDNNLVAMEDVEGVYFAKINGVGNFLMFMQKPMGLVMVLLIILVVGLVWLYVVNKKDEKKYLLEDEKERLEFEEYKKMKQQNEKHDDKN